MIKLVPSMEFQILTNLNQLANCSELTSIQYVNSMKHLELAFSLLEIYSYQESEMYGVRVHGYLTLIYSST